MTWTARLRKAKSSLDPETANLLGTLIRIVKGAVISGGSWPQFQMQLLAKLPHSENLRNLSLLPTCGTKFFRFESSWEMLYSEDFTEEEKRKIVSSLKQAIGLPRRTQKPKQLGEVQIEDRGSQITFSALGQQAPLEEKKMWGP